MLVSSKSIRGQKPLNNVNLNFDPVVCVNKMAKRVGILIEFHIPTAATG